MKRAMRKGIGFGLTSGIITTLGLMVGLNSGTHSKQVVLGGILLIAIADALSDALGMHISEESSSKSTTAEHIWASTFFTVLSKFLFAISFAIPVIFFDLYKAIIIGIIWGLLLLASFSFIVAKKRKENPFRAVFEHITIAGIVILATYFLGNWIATWAI